MYKILLCASLLISSVFSSAQSIGEKVNVYGTIQDIKTGEAIVGATVYNQSTKQVSISNRYGHFNMQINSGKCQLAFSSIGYQTDTASLQLIQDTILNIRLNAITFEIAGVQVSAQRSLGNVYDSQVGSHRITAREIERMPSFLGEADAIKTLQMLPGVQGGVEGSSALIVRGGSPDQNLMLIDGVPVFNATHLFGFFSVFPPEAINSVDFYKGGFPARYGGRLSSVVDVTMKEGNMKHITGDVSIGTMSSKLLLEGPIVKDKGAFLFSVRRTYFDLLFSPIYKQQFTSNEDGSLGYHFYDITAKASYALSPKDKLLISTYTGRDKLYNSYEEKFSEYSSSSNKSDVGLLWGNFTSALRWNRIHTPLLSSNLSLNYGQFRYNSFTNYIYKEDGVEEPRKTNLDFNSNVKELSLRLECDWMINAKHKLKFGGNVSSQNFLPTHQFYQSDLEDVNNEAVRYEALEASLFNEWHFEPTQRWKVNAGIRASIYHTSGESYYAIQPRFSSRYLLNKNHSIKVSYSRMYQPIHMLTTGSMGFPSDIWVPATEKLKPQYSNQVSIGHYAKIKGTFDFSAEAFYKRMYNQIHCSESMNLASTLSSFEENIEVGGRGRSYGAEFLLRKTRGKTTGWVAYTLAWNKRQFDSVNQGEWFYYQYDRRHDFKTTIQHDFSEKYQLSANWTLASGYPFSIPLVSYQGYPNFMPDHVYDYLTGSENYGVDYINYVENLNNARAKLYHRLDIAFNVVTERKNGKQIWTFGLYNAYSRKNALMYKFEYGKDDNVMRLKEVSMFPIMPFVTYRYQFK